MNERRTRALLWCGVGVILAGCAPKEYGSLSPNRADWLGADAEAANLAVEVTEPEILPRTHFSAGQLFEQQGDVRKAVIQYRRAVAEGPDYVPAYNRLGVLLGRLGQHTEAEQTLKKAVKLRPDWAFLYNNLGFEYMLQGRWGDAEAVLRTAIRLKPEFGRAHNNLAMVLFKTGRFEESLSEFQHVVPEVDAHYNLGLMFRGQHRYRDAADAFERVLSMAPSFEAAKVQLDQIAPHLRIATTLEPAAKMDDWETVAQTGTPPVAPEPGTVAVEADATPESEVRIAERDVPEAHDADVIAEETTPTVAPEQSGVDREELVEAFAAAWQGFDVLFQGAGPTGGQVSEEPSDAEFENKPLEDDPDTFEGSPDVADEPTISPSWPNIDPQEYDDAVALARTESDVLFQGAGPTGGQVPEELPDAELDNKPLESDGDTFEESPDVADEPTSTSRWPDIDPQEYDDAVALARTEFDAFLRIEPDLPADRKPAAPPAGDGTGAGSDWQGYLFPDHPIADYVAAPSKSEPHEPAGDETLRELSELIDETAPWLLPPF